MVRFINYLLSVSAVLISPGAGPRGVLGSEEIAWGRRVLVVSEDRTPATSLRMAGGRYPRGDGDRGGGGDGGDGKRDGVGKCMSFVCEIGGDGWRDVRGGGRQESWRGTIGG